MPLLAKSANVCFASARQAAQDRTWTLDRLQRPHPNYSIDEIIVGARNTGRLSSVTNGLAIWGEQVPDRQINRSVAGGAVSRLECGNSSPSY
jgi:hypothetical protein